MSKLYWRGDKSMVDIYKLESVKAFESQKDKNLDKWASQNLEDIKMEKIFNSWISSKNDTVKSFNITKD